MSRITYVAAHAGFSLGQVPLGGGASVCEHLIEEWRRTRPFEVEVISPAILANQAPQHDALVRMSEWRYAQFCTRFEKAATQRLLQDSPTAHAVLINDISEGPDFRRLAEAGYPLFTIYHVDVLDYFLRMYARGLVTPERAAAFYRGLTGIRGTVFVPRILKLVFQKQADSVRYSKGLIVPSERMRQVLEACYPQDAPGKVHVIPWGIWEPTQDPSPAEERWGLVPGAPVLLTLSRISPEKGQDRLLQAIGLWEHEPSFPKEGLTLLIAGEAAYMQGARFLKKLQALSAQLHKTKVIFTGYAAGARKQTLFRLADLYVFPSRHESYGLTMLEAMQAALPVLATATHGARDVFRPEFGELVADPDQAEVPEQLKEALKRLLGDRMALKKKGQAAQAYARQQHFYDAAARIAELLKDSMGVST